MKSIRREFLRTAIAGILLPSMATAQSTHPSSHFIQSKQTGIPLSIDLDPLLVGKNIFFSDKWLEFIGTNKQITRAQFEKWRNQVDIMYNCFVDFTAKLPSAIKKIYLNIENKEVMQKTFAHAHSSLNGNFICYNKDALSNSSSATWRYAKME